MQIGKRREPFRTQYFENLSCGDTFYYKGDCDTEAIIYMKIPFVTNINRWEKNAIRLKDGSLNYISDNPVVVVANVHIEED